MTRSRIKIEANDRIPNDVLTQIIQSAYGVNRVRTIERTPKAVYVIVDANPTSISLTAIRNAASEYHVDGVWVRRHFPEDTIIA